MLNFLKRYYHWLHGQWPAGEVEKLPVVGLAGATNIAGVRIVGDLAGPALLKFASETGAEAVRFFAAELQKDTRNHDDSVVDIAIVGAGVSGVAAALEAKKEGLSYVLIEATEAFSTLKNFPLRKPIYTYPATMEPKSELRVQGKIKESLVDSMVGQYQAAGVETMSGMVSEMSAGDPVQLTLSDGRIIPARRVVVAIGRSGNFRKLKAPVHKEARVYNRLHDPAIHAGQNLLVVGGGDSALETANALADAGAHVTLSYRKKQLVRPKDENRIELETRVDSGTIDLQLGSHVQSVGQSSVQLESDSGETHEIPTHAVYAMLGRDAPLSFFRRSGIAVQGEWSKLAMVGLVGFLSFCVWLYHWKSYGYLTDVVSPAAWMAEFVMFAGDAANESTSLLYTLIQSAKGPSFYYTLLYSLAVLVFGVRRMRNRKTPYVRLQTLCLILVQWLPLFILPEMILPWMGRNELFIEGAALRPFADLFFEPYDGGVGIERAYWRSYGFVLAWPLMVYNWFTDQPMWGWLVLGSLQTFVIIPLLIRRWGKGAMCGWICSCGALAETLGDAHRHKMPHGPKWNKVNLIGQVILAAACLLMVIRVWGWLSPNSWAAASFHELLAGNSPLTYKWLVDVFLGGVLGVGLYFHFSGRMWCRFACPLAALMNIYGRFSRFRIFSDKKKCISCNVCTSVCHQGIDVMNFANRGKPMEDPQCVRCSACVSSCPTGTLSFGRLSESGEPIHDQLSASLVQIGENRRA